MIKAGDDGFKTFLELTTTSVPTVQNIHIYEDAEWNVPALLRLKLQLTKLTGQCTQQQTVLNTERQFADMVRISLSYSVHDLV